MSIPEGASREELLAALAERDAVIEALLVCIEMLERRVGMDSSNSTMPPGSDGPAARARRAKQRKKKQSPNRRLARSGDHMGWKLASLPNAAPQPGSCTPTSRSSVHRRSHPKVTTDQGPHAWSTG